MSNKSRTKKLDVDFIGGEALTPEEEADLKEFFAKKKRRKGRKTAKEGFK